ncbi:hypothetical protein ABDK56_05500 [Sphingomonas sp. ASV193]|uniref:hypothetical protein n=1 Tax=Sphingomonas sp. ASV193 TaxID=3144405 RepID=UPI0032E913F8
MSDIHIVFAAGRGGAPRRHAALIERIEAAGIGVSAPDFPMLANQRPTAQELTARAEALAEAIAAAPAGAPVVGVGHSIGATLLLALAGGQMWLDRSGPLPSPRSARLVGLVLLAPPVGFFGAPGAVERVALPLMFRVGAVDTLTPPAALLELVERLRPRCPVDYAVLPDAGHFAFMDVAPPGHEAEVAASAQLRAGLAGEIVRFARDIEGAQ